MGALFGFLKLICSAPDNYDFSVLEEVGQDLFEVEEFRSAIDYGEKDYPKRAPHGRVFIEVVEDNLGDSLFLQLYYDPHSIPVGFVPHSMDPFNLFITDKLGDFFYQLCFVNLVWDLVNNYVFPLAFGLLFHYSPGPHFDDSAS